MKTGVIRAVSVALLFAGIGSIPAWGQAAQTSSSAQSNIDRASFDVAFIRLVDATELRAVAAQNPTFSGILACNGGIELTPGRIRITAATVFRLIAAAYGQPCGAALDLKLIIGGPDWIQKDAFHIQAVMPAGTPDYSFQQLQNGEAPVLQAMLRNLLAER
ncbi:MAG: TIGR03435 family protein, partial [Acidobacteriota bacterium]